MSKRLSIEDKERLRKHRDIIVRYMNSYIKSITDREEMDPIQIYFAKNEIHTAKLWLYLNEPYMDEFSYWVAYKYLDILDTYIFTKTIQGRRMQREKIN